MSNSMKTRQLGAELLGVEREKERERETDQWKDMTKLIIALSTSANAPDVQSVNDTYVNIFPLLDLPSLVFAVSCNWLLRDSGHMALRPQSDKRTLSIIKKLFLIMLTLLSKVFLQKLFKLLLSPKFY